MTEHMINSLSFINRIDMIETVFQKKILNFLEKNNIYTVKQNASALTKSGIPDIISNIRGLFVAIEVKKDKYSKTTELQKYNIKKINDLNAIAIVLRPDKFNLFKEVITDFLKFEIIDIESCKEFKKTLLEKMDAE